MKKLRHKLLTWSGLLGDDPYALSFPPETLARLETAIKQQKS